MKFSEVQIKRSIIKNIPKTTHCYLTKAGIGCDYARLLLHSDVVIAEGVCVLEDMADMEYAFVKLYNNLRVGQAVPFAITDSIIMPFADERHMKKILMQLANISQKYGVDIITGHTEISEAVNRPVITMTMLGKADSTKTAEKNMNLSGVQSIKSGMDIVMCGQTGIMGTVRLTEGYKDKLLERYSETYLGGAVRLKDYMLLRDEIDIACDVGICYSHDISAGGVYAALWEMADAAEVGIDVCHDRIPILQETIEVCEYTGHNPYMIDGSGAALFVTEKGEQLSDALYEAGYEAAVIGRVTENMDRTITHDDERRFLTPPNYKEI